MNKTAIKNFAIWARNKLIADISYKAGLLGITEKGIKSPLPQSTQTVQFFDIGTKEPSSITGIEIQQRKKLVEEIERKAKQSDYTIAYKNVIEEVAYTWFNRLIAIRFMEVNDYLPTRIRVLSSESNGKAEPDLVTHALEANFDYSAYEKDRIIQLKLDNKLDELFRMLFIKQCNALNINLPELFEKTNDYTELLLNVSFTDKEGVVYHLVNDISEDDFNVTKEGQVEIIGWMYQYYNTEPKDETFALLKKNVKITKEKIPAATQLFTPDWIVRYMVENSLGRLWLESHPNPTLKANWKYYLDEAEQTPEVAEKLRVMRSQSPVKSPEDIRLIDPCMGSGHILVYAFDVLMQIYESVGVSPREAAKLILEKNIYGLDIDRRAYQLAYFSLMMKARQYNRRIFTDGVKPQVYHPAGFTDGEEYGSLAKVGKLPVMPEQQIDQLTIFDDYDRDLRIWNFKRLLAQKYDVVITNPPYMGRKSLNGRMSSYIEENFIIGKSELYSAFIVRCYELAKEYGYIAMITMHTWMFISTFKNLWSHLLTNTRFVSMMHTGAATFEELNSFNVLATSFVYEKSKIMDDYKTTFLRLSNYYQLEDKIENFNNKNDRYYVKQKNFEAIPEQPFIYWFTEKTYGLFEQSQSVSDYGVLTNGLFTCDNKRFVRNWFEVSVNKIYFDSNDSEEAENSGKKWFPYIKGGNYCKWYGNNEFVVNYQFNGSEIRNYRVQQGQSKSFPGEAYYFKPGITWAPFGFENFGVRYKEHGSIFDIAGSSLFVDDYDVELYILGFLASKVGFYLLSAMAPTVNFQIGNIGNLPMIINDEYKETIVDLVKENILIAKQSWNSYEESWEFCKHPLLQDTDKIEIAYKSWKQRNASWYSSVKQNEEKMNECFSQIYGLSAEINKEVIDRDISIRKADFSINIRSFISYAVGCMFGRYSLDTDGLVYAGGDWDSANYKSFTPDKDNILPICDDEYFDDDILGRFVDFIRVVYGVETLEENLKFIADALGGKGIPREVIRNYFLNDFYKDHCKIYQKRPIYWQFDSGKKNGFKALIYMHRYDENTIGNLRIDYLHKMQRIYENEIGRMQDAIENSKDAREVTAATKRKEKLIKQLQETKEYDEKIAHLALARISIDLDDGVKVNYEKVQTDRDGKKLDVLAKI